MGKITAIKIPAPSARAHSPSPRQFLILSPPYPLVYYHYIQAGDNAKSRRLFTSGIYLRLWQGRVPPHDGPDHPTVWKNVSRTGGEGPNLVPPPPRYRVGEEEFYDP